MSRSRPEGRITDASRDRRTPSQPPTIEDEVNGIKRKGQAQADHLPLDNKEREEKLWRKVLEFKEIWSTPYNTNTAQKSN